MRWKIYRHSSGWWRCQQGTVTFEFRDHAQAIEFLYPKPVALDTSSWPEKLREFYR